MIVNSINHKNILFKMLNFTLLDDFKMQNLINKINQSENFKKKNYITVNDFNEITKIDNTVLGKFLLDVL